MPTLLHLDSSASSASGSRSRAITKTFADEWRAAGQRFSVVYRDLHAEPLPHFPDAALHWPAGSRPEGANPPPAAERLQAELIAELSAADAVLIGSPLYNYTMPSTLKAWVDYIHIPGLLGPAAGQPLKGRPVVIVTSRGGLYDEGTASAGWDHGAPVLEIVLGSTLGMTTEVITTSATLATVAPALAKHAARAEMELAAAHSDAAASARRLAGGL